MGTYAIHDIAYIIRNDALFAGDGIKCSSNRPTFGMSHHDDQTRFRRGRREFDASDERRRDEDRAAVMTNARNARAALVLIRPNK